MTYLWRYLKPTKKEIQKAKEEEKAWIPREPFLPAKRVKQPAPYKYERQTPSKV